MKSRVESAVRTVRGVVGSGVSRVGRLAGKKSAPQKRTFRLPGRKTTGVVIVGAALASTAAFVLRRKAAAEDKQDVDEVDSSSDGVRGDTPAS